MRAFRVLAAASAVSAASFHCYTFEEAPPVTGPDDAAAESAASSDGGDVVDGSVADGCTAEIAADPKNCGRCGHDCLGGKCVAGKCQPLVLAQGLVSPGELALAGDRVFFDVSGATGKRDIVACNLPDCAGGPALIVSGVATVRSLLFHDGLLLFNTHDTTSTENRIDECTATDAPTCASTLRVIEPSVSNIFDAFTPLRRTADGVYWAFSSGGTASLRRLPLAAGASATSVADLGCPTRRISPGATDLAWTCLAGGLRTCALPCAVDGGTPAVDGGADGELERGSVVVFENKSNGALTILGPPQRALPPRGPGPFTIVADTLVYHDSQRAEIIACTLPACASRMTLADAPASRLAADDRRVVWTNASAGTVVQVAR